MYVDAQDNYGIAQAVTTTALSTNIIDHVGYGDDYNQPWLQISVPTAFAGGTSLAINLITDYTSAFNGAPVTIPLVPATPVANLTAGAVLYKAQYPQGMHEFRQLQYVVVGTMTAGTISAVDLIDVQTNRDKLGYSSGAGINQ